MQLVQTWIILLLIGIISINGQDKIEESKDKSFQKKNEIEFLNTHTLIKQIYI